jgi:sugar (pentulose or hexulose) kinase
MSSACVIGIDKGTTATKAVVFSAANGRVLGQAHVATGPLYPKPGWHEEDMDQSFAKVAACLRAAMQAAGITGADVAGLGISGHMGGLWALDAEGAPVGRAIAWPDGRAAPMLGDWRAEGRLAEIFAIAGNAPIPGVPLVLLAWLKAHEPARLSRIATVLAAKDYLNWRLTGVLATDESDLSFFPCDIRSRRHSERLFALAGVPEMARALPPVLPTGAVVGRVTPEAAALTGLAAGTPVTTGAGDAVAAALGAGATEPGQAVTVIGTSFMNNLTTARPLMEPAGVGFLFLMPGGRWQRLMANTGGGTLCLDWALDAFFAEAQAGAADRGAFLAEAGAAAARVPPLAGGVITHPYFNTSGMSAPRFDPEARASIFGCDTGTDAPAMLRSVMEGVGFAMRECYEALAAPVTDIRITGGGARSALWRQICAAAVNRPLQVPEAEETGALGVALLAAVAAGCQPDLRAAARAMVRSGPEVHPDADLAACYDRAYPLFRDLGQALSEHWQTRAALLAKHQAEGNAS